MAKKIEQIITADVSGFLRGTQQVKGSLGSLTGEFRSFQSVAGKALSFAGVGLGAAEIIGLADTYGQLSARLRLVTQYSGDFAEVQQALQESARNTRSDLGGTVNLYAQLAPSLRAIGIDGKQSVGIITTINKAIGLSGASSQAAEAALMQLGQGFASGALRGEELNSVMEQTPALAQAIADGLGVTRGELRTLGAEGKLTAEVVATALQKVADQVDRDFAQAPVTVGQAFTNLKNQFMVFVGAVDSSSGGTSALAGAINAVADEFANAGPVVTAFSAAISTLANGIDAINRMLKILIIGVAGYAAAAKAAFIDGNLAEARTIWRSIGEDIDAVLQKQLAGTARTVSAQADVASKRLELERQLAAEVTKLEQLKAFESGKALDNIAAKDKANIDARIKDQQRLVDAVRAAWQESLKEAEKFASAAQSKLTKATDFRQRGQDAAFNANIKGLTPEEQAAAKQQRMQDLAGQGNYEAARARMAAIEGDVKKYDAAAAAAEKKLLAALALAEQVGDATAAEEIGNELAKIYEAGAALDKKQQADAEQRAAAQAKTMNDLQAQLDAMTKEARKIEIQAEVTKAEGAIKGLQSQLDAIKDKTITVTVNTVSTPAPEGMTVEELDARIKRNDLPGYASGGIIRGPGSGTSDSILARLSNGEGVIRNRAVSYYGENLIHRINSLQLPKFANGGIVGGSKSAGTPVVLDFGKLGRYNAEASEDTATALVRVFKRAALTHGRR